MEFDRVRERLIQLQELSQDPEYDRYLAQMIRDLDAGKATPEQVEQEAQRSYRLYQQRMQAVSYQSGQGKKHSTEREVEFKVGIHAFGLIGAIFVLMAVIIFCFNFLKFETDFAFLIFTVIFFVINFVCVVFRGQKKHIAVNIVHLVANLFFAVVVTGLAQKEGIGAVYLAIFVITAFITTNFMAYVQCRGKKETPLFPFICIENGLFLFLLFLIGNIGQEVRMPAQALFVHLIAEVLIVFDCILLFLLWDKEDDRKWAQVYYGAGAVLLLNSFSEYHLEIIIGQLVVLLIVKLLNSKKELTALECIVVAWVGFTGLWLSDYWYCWIFAGALILGAFRLRYLPIYQEIVTTISVLLIWWSQCGYYFADYGLEFKWFYPVSVGILLLFFLLFNRAACRKKADQKIYNIINLTGMMILYLIALLVHDWQIGLIMMALSAVTVVVIFGKRYGMYLPRRYLLLTGVWLAYALICCVDSPVLASILLMVSALGCVGIGFKMSDKVARICGLGMAIFVCLKLVLYDFANVQTIHKMIVFLVVGILALVISFLYILLDKSAEKKTTQECREILQIERKTEE